MLGWHHQKIPVLCPSCGREQFEPSGYISTICRACGDCFHPVDPPYLASRHHKIVWPATNHHSPSSTISVLCHQCNTKHDVPNHTQSTTCPCCSKGISLQDIAIVNHSSIPVDTRGNLTIESQGYLFSSHSVCKDAMIYGRIAGTLICEGTLTLQTHSSNPVKLRAQEILIPKEAEIICPFPMEANNITITGTLRANLIVSGKLTIKKKGVVEGEIQARAIQVDPGGEMFGQMQITPLALPPLPNIEHFNRIVLAPRKKRHYTPIYPIC